MFLAYTHGGIERAYIGHVPRGAGAKPLPVVINMHGGGGNAESQQRYSGMDRVADRERFLVVYPDGTGRSRAGVHAGRIGGVPPPGRRDGAPPAVETTARLLTWNAGTCCGAAAVRQAARDTSGRAAARTSSASSASRRISSTRARRSGRSFEEYPHRVKGNVKGGAIRSRLAFVRDHGGEEAVRRVLARLSEEDRKECARVLPASWYPFELNARLDEAIAAEMAMGEKVFLLMGEKSAAHNLGSTHRVFIVDRDPHGLLRRAAQIYQAYYDTGRRTYERLGDTKAVLRTYDSETFSKHDCLTVVGWHRKAIEMCGGTNARVTETKCRASGADVCEYVCEWK